MQMDILDLLASENYVPYNKTLAKQLGIECAILFATLCGYQRHYQNEEFYREQEKIIEDTCLSEYAIRQATKTLTEIELISVVKKGLPAKNYYKINKNKLLECLSTSGCENNTTRDSENTTTNNKINNKTNKNKNIQKENNTIESEIFDYWNSKNIVVHRTLSSEIQGAIKKGLSTLDSEEIKKCITRYDIVLKDKKYYFNYVWNLKDFLTRKNGISSFTDEGSKWLDYKSQTGFKEIGINTIQKKTIKVDNNGVFSI